MKGIDIIIPIHEYNKSVSELLKRCLLSLKEMAIESSKNNILIDIHVVGDSALPYDEIMKLIDWGQEFNSFNVSENKTNNLDFCSQVNYSVNEICSNDYFMIVEFDDMVNKKWLNMVLPYINEKNKCPMFLPLTEIYDIKNSNMPLSYINEIAWSSAFVDGELGVLNNGSLHDFYNFNITGAIINRRDFIKAGCLKPSIKLSFGYELLLRFTNLFSEIFVVPKVGYFHFVNREGSLTSEYHKTMTKEEGSWWIKLALEEYQYKKDRNKTYTPEKD